MAKLTRFTIIGLIAIPMALMAGCGQDKDALRDLPEPATKPGHGRTFKPVPPLQEAPSGTPLAAGAKGKN